MGPKKIGIVFFKKCGEIPTKHYKLIQIDSSQNIDKLYIMNDDDEDSKVTNILFSDTSSDEEDSLRDIFVNSSEDEIVAQRTISKSKKQL